jgi:hypothetical protein
MGQACHMDFLKTKKAAYEKPVAAPAPADHHPWGEYSQCLHSKTVTTIKTSPSDSFRWTRLPKCRLPVGSCARLLVACGTLISA